MMFKNPTDIRLIIFDIGGVLVNFDNSQMCVRLANYTNSTFDRIYDHLFKYGLESKYELGQIKSDDVYSYFKAHFHMNCDIYDFVNAWNAGFRKVDGMDRLVKHLTDSNYDLALLSNTNDMHFRYMISQRHQLIDLYLFTYWFTSYNIGMRKPDLNIADYISDATATDKKHMLFIDDTEINVESMKEQGVCSIKFINESKLWEELKSIGVVE